MTGPAEPLERVEVVATWGTPRTGDRDHVYRRVRRTVVVEVDERECLACGEWLPFDAFGYHRGIPRARCQSCRYLAEIEDPRRLEYRRWRTRCGEAARKGIPVACTFEEWLEVVGNRVCWRCGEPGADEVDAIRPHVHGGPLAPDNLRPAHARCPGHRHARETWAEDRRAVRVTP